MILPTVFAVQASAEMIFQERLAAANTTSYVEGTRFRGLPPVHCSNRPSQARTAAEMPATLLTSDAGGFSAGTASVGGAQ
jgi:hypothetical protein